jgi:hypothetical protein
MNGFTYRLMSAIALLALTFGGYVNANVSPALLALDDPASASPVLLASGDPMPVGQAGLWDIAFENIFGDKVSEC